MERFETLRAAGFANYGGAELGEVLTTARAIPEGDEVAWHREWKATAERVEKLGRESVLVLDAENDQFLKGQPALAAAAMTKSDTTL